MMTPQDASIEARLAATKSRFQLANLKMIMSYLIQGDPDMAMSILQTVIRFAEADLAASRKTSDSAPKMDWRGDV